MTNTKQSLVKGYVWAVMMVMTAGGCAPPPDGEDEEIDETGQAVSAGTVVTSNTAPYNSVVRIATRMGGCTATKIGTRRFLSAGHCFVSGGSAITAGDSIQLTNRLDGVFVSGTSFTITRIDRHPSFDAFVLQGAGTIPGGAAIFEATVLEISADTSSIPSLPLRTGFVSPGTSATVVGYGCDAINPSNGGVKQRGTINTVANSNAEQFAHVWTTSGPATVCPGDSGGPDLMRNPSQNNRWEVAGINLGFGPGATSWLGRVGSVLAWIKAPKKNSFSDGQKGFFMNGKSLYCLGVDGGSSSSGALAKQFYCDGRNQPSDHEYWQLKSNGSGTFRVVNSKSGHCLDVEGGSITDGARLVQKTCASASTTNSQAWRFQSSLPDFFRIENAKSGACIVVNSADGSGNGTGLIQSTCINNAAPDRQTWLFTR
jgi:hypothetical protein